MATEQKEIDPSRVRRDVKTGRPGKLTPELQERLCDVIRVGNYYEPACNFVGVSYGSFKRWMIRGEHAPNGPYGAFRTAILKAKADSEVTLVQTWRKLCPEDARATRDLLSRRFPKRWAPKPKAPAGEQPLPPGPQTVVIYLPERVPVAPGLVVDQAAPSAVELPPHAPTNGTNGTH